MTRHTDLAGARFVGELVTLEPARLPMGEPVRVTPLSGGRFHLAWDPAQTTTHVLETACRLVLARQHRPPA
ncbi:hypothetical protein ACFXGD_21505 [Streptomyces albidoflavus]